MKRFKQIALDGLVKQNPTFKLVLGTCPTLALTTAISSSFGMGLAVTFVLICSNVIISLLRNIIPNKVRIPCFIVIIATFVTLVRMAMDAFLPDLYSSLGVYLPLIVVNCIILGRAEGFASKNPVGESALDGLFMGLGFTIALTMMGAFRQVMSDVVGIKFFGSSAGAFLTFGLFIAVFTVAYDAIERGAQKRAIAAGKQQPAEEINEEKEEVAD